VSVQDRSADFSVVNRLLHALHWLVKTALADNAQLDPGPVHRLDHAITAL
jgi:hypothetical protein